MGSFRIGWWIWFGAFFASMSAAQTLVMDTRQNNGAASAYCEKNRHCELARSMVREFSNGNTFVQIDSGLANREVTILSPGRMSSDTFMEVLLKAHTAHTWGARRIHVILDGPMEVRDDEELILTETECRSFMAHAGVSTLESGASIDHLVRPTIRTHVKYRANMTNHLVSFQHENLGRELGQALGLESINGETTDLRDLPRRSQVVFVSAITPPTNRHLFKSIRLVRELKNRGNRVIQVLPYLPYVRSDKIDQPGVTVGAKLVADLIQSSGVDLVAFVKLHAAQAQGYFQTPTLHIETRSDITAMLRDLHVDGVVSPDAGFQKEATLYANKVNLPVYVINKQRNPRTGDLEMQKMGDFDVHGKILAVIDDETASGSTLVSSAEFLMAQGAAAVYAFVSHLAGDAAKALGSPVLKALYVTDTFPVANLGDQVRVIAVARAVADAIKPYLATPCSSLLEKPN